MEKYKFDESNGLWYELQGDYYLPCLKLPEEERVYIGIWGQRHLRYLKGNRRVLLSNLQLSGELNSYLADMPTLNTRFRFIGNLCATFRTSD